MSMRTSISMWSQQRENDAKIVVVQIRKNRTLNIAKSGTKQKLIQRLH